MRTNCGLADWLAYWLTNWLLMNSLKCWVLTNKTHFIPSFKTFDCTISALSIILAEAELSFLNTKSFPRHPFITKTFVPACKKNQWAVIYVYMYLWNHKKYKRNSMPLLRIGILGFYHKTFDIISEGLLIFCVLYPPLCEKIGLGKKGASSSFSLSFYLSKG